jgi:hypothetical protein
VAKETCSDFDCEQDNTIESNRMISASIDTMTHNNTHQCTQHSYCVASQQSSCKQPLPVRFLLVEECCVAYQLIHFCIYGTLYTLVIVHYDKLSSSMSLACIMCCSAIVVTVTVAIAILTIVSFTSACHC